MNTVSSHLPKKDKKKTQGSTRVVDLPKTSWRLYLKKNAQLIVNGLKYFFRAHWIGTTFFIIATLVFFWPLILHITNYSEGGDAMFNAWTLARNYHCILHQACSNYANANIYFPHKDTMLYSETQLSAGVLTLPLYFIDKNPIFPYNVWTIMSFFFSGWFMYLLAKYLSKGKEVYSILAGLVFEFAPFKMAAISHLQNLSIFYLPLAVLLILKYFETRKKSYLFFLFVALSLQFYASWYQMIFVLIALGILLLGMLLFKLANWRRLVIVGGIVLLAALSTYPLAKTYTQFSKSNDATFNLTDQITYSSSLEDYFKPTTGTILGKIYYHLRPHAQVNSFDSDSFSYHGMILYAVALCVLIIAYIRRKDDEVSRKKYRFILVFVAIALAGFIMSLGPALKIRGNYFYTDTADGLRFVLPLPWLLVDKFLPQLSFIRAIGRASVLTLFSLCCLLAFFPLYLQKEKFYQKYKLLIVIIVSSLVVIELMPTHLVGMTNSSFDYNLNIPAVYKYINDHPQINDMVIISSEQDYPGAAFPTLRAEEVLWSGYDNRNIFNGYSGYTPPTYFSQLAQFNNFGPDVVPQMKALGLKYVLVDKQLSESNPQLILTVKKTLPDKVYEDSRYALFKL
jgi:hypothetical protein